ncbi:hypothetical protein THAOC_17131 [Thalassiosira oceanica]|uniref:Uncharacterized protein n=1 Tax=Thalassiosira oceanica TaxID=159749 RepID=K0S847_THAOC|nr:hypothetical protein THAOC_17131 [Thalassiosira oceanica]|eukprot:EJK62263.1 hypothetical protein THAOC_17131 [Thalassiosira oceanica]
MVDSRLPAVGDTGGPEISRAAPPQHIRGGLRAHRCRRRRCDIAYLFPTAVLFVLALPRRELSHVRNDVGDKYKDNRDIA